MTHFAVWGVRRSGGPTKGRMIRMRKAVLTAIGLILGISSVALAQTAQQPVQPVDVYVRSAKIALKTNPPEYKRALNNLYMAREHYPQNYEVHYLLGSIWADKDEIDSMLAEWDVAEMVATDKQWKGIQDKLAKIKEQKWLDQFNRAVKLVYAADTAEERGMAAQESDPHQGDSLIGIAGQARELAKEALRHCSILLPRDFRAYSTRGLIYQREGIVDSGLADFVKAESLFHRNEFEDSTTNWYDTTSFFSGPEGKPTNLFKEYEKKYKKLSDEKRTRYRNLLIALIGSYYDSEQWEKTIAIARRFYGLDPDDINNIVTMADVFSRLGMDDQAFQWQEAVVRRDPGSKDTWYNMGIFYYNTAVRLQDSVLKYERAVQDDPKSTGDKEMLHTFLTSRLENFYKAVPRFEKVVELDPKDDDTWRLLGVCRYSLASLTGDLAAAGETQILQNVFEGSVPDEKKLWADAQSGLGEAIKRYPDEQNLCYMMKVTLAQMGNAAELQKWKEKCP